MKINEKLDDGFYIAGWCVLAVLVIAILGMKITGLQPGGYGMPCMLHALTGYYCPGCGGTRAAAAFLRGDILRSFFYHPIVPYAALLGGWFMVSQTAWRLSGKRLRIGMHFRTVYLWIALGLIAANFLVKNIALAVWHLDLLAW